MNYLVPDKKKPDANTDMNMDKQKARDKKKREHLLPEHAHENPWKVAAAAAAAAAAAVLCCSVIVLFSCLPSFRPHAHASFVVFCSVLVRSYQQNPQ
jgi:hypothetical protein